MLTCRSALVLHLEKQRSTQSEKVGGNFWGTGLAAAGAAGVAVRTVATGLGAAGRPAAAAAKAALAPGAGCPTLTYIGEAFMPPPVCGLMEKEAAAFSPAATAALALRLAACASVAVRLEGGGIWW